MSEDKRRIVVLPKRLVDEIDEHRGDMSRSGFIESCISELLRSGEEGGAGVGEGKRYVTWEDFERFKSKVKDLLLSFLEFSSAYGAIPSRGKEKEGRGREEGIEDLKRNVEESLSPGKTGAGEEGAAEPPERIPEEATRKPKDIAVGARAGLEGAEAGTVAEAGARAVEAEDKERGEDFTTNILWIPALLLFGFGDTLTSYMSFLKGGIEANRALAWLMGFAGGIFHMGDSFLPFLIVKSAILVALCAATYTLIKESRWIVPLILALLGAYLTANNVAFLWP